MRIFIAFDGSYEPFDVSPNDTVDTIKQRIKDYFHVPLPEDHQGQQYLELMYAGAVLRDVWSLADIGISFCSTLKCFVKKEDRPALYVFNAVTRETMPVVENTSLLDKKVSDLRKLVTRRCGFPVSVYCLRTPKGLEMYDCNTLRDYGTDIGTTLRLDVWDGWKEFLLGCLLGQTVKVQRYLFKEGPVLKYQRRVALYIAAFYGHTELTEWALKQGAQPHEAVGVHPYRAWCQETLHADVAQCPIHAAAETGQLLTVKTFVNCSVLCLECRNAAGQTPLAIAVQHQHKDCVLYLRSKLWSTVSFLKTSVPVRIYIKIKQWLLRAQSRRLHGHALYRSRMARAKVGDTMVVDGFTKPKMTSKSWHKAGDKDPQDTPRKLPPCTEQTAGRKHVSSLAISPGDAGEEPLTLPALAAGKRVSEPQERQRGPAKAAARKKDKHGDAYLPQVPLPPQGRVDCSHPPRAHSRVKSPFKSFSEHCGKTPRENAIYCLAMASSDVAT